MERVAKNVRSFIFQFLIMLLTLGTVLVFTNCTSLKQLFDLKGIIVSKDDQIFQGDSATVTIDISDIDKSYSFIATSDPVDNGYPIKIETSNVSTVSVSQSATVSGKYTINAVSSGWCDVLVQCSVAYKFKFIVFVTDNAKGITVSSLSSQRDEYYAQLAAAEDAENVVEETTSTPAATTSTPVIKPVVLKLTSTTPVNVTCSAPVLQLGKSCTFTAVVENVTEKLTYQWYTENGTAVSGATGKTYTVTPSAVGNVSYYVQVKGEDSGITRKSAVVSAEVVKEKVFVSAATSVQIQSNVKTAEHLDRIKFTSTVDAVDEELLYQWYSNNKALGTVGYKDGHMPTMDYAPIDAGSYSVYLEVTGATSGVKVKSQPITVTYQYVDHRPEHVGSWINEKSPDSGRYMDAEGKTYNMYKDSKSGEWIYKPEVIATLASHGYVFTDKAAGTSTISDLDNNRLVVTANGVRTNYVKSTVVPRAANYVDASTNLTISTKTKDLEVNKTVKIISKKSALDEDLTYQWYVNGKAVVAPKGTAGTFEDTSAEPKTNEYYLVATGSVSGEKITSNKISVTFNKIDHRSEYAGAWINDKNAKDGRYVASDGKIYSMYKDDKSGEWIYKPEAVASISATGYEITDLVTTDKTKISNDKLVVTSKGVDSTYSKSTETPRAAEYVDSSTVLTISTKTKTLEVNKTVKFISKKSELDEDLTYQWYVNGKAVIAPKGTASSLEDTSAEPKTNEYYLVAKGVISGKTVTSNKISVTFNTVDHRSEFTGAWINDKNAKDGRYVADDGKIYSMYKDDKSGDWLYKPDAVATIAATGYDITDLVTSDKTKISDGKIVVTSKGVDSTYSKAAVTTRAAEYVDSSTTLTISTKLKTIEVDETVKFISKKSVLDEDLTYQWYVNGKALMAPKGTADSLEDTSSAPKTNEYYLVAKGSISGKTVTSNKVSVSFITVDHRPEFAGAWVSEKNNDGSGRYIAADGKIYYMYADEDANAWLYESDVIATMAATGYGITDSVSTNQTKIVKDKIVVTEKGVEKTYVKSQVAPRAAKLIDSTTKLTITASATTAEVQYGYVTINSNISDLDEGVTYMWYINGTAVDNKNGTKSSYETDECPDPRTNEYYLVAKGKRSGKTVTSNKVKVTFNYVDHRPEFAGAWVSEKNNDGSGRYIAADGKIYYMYADEDANAWLYEPDVIATMASKGYEITDNVSANKTKIVKGKLVVTEKGVEKTYVKSQVAPRAAKLIDSTTKLTITASATTAEVQYGYVTINSNISDLDEGVTYMWYINGTAVNNKSGTKSSYETDECPDPRTNEYYLVAKGSRSGKTVTSNKVKVTFNYVDHRPEFAGAWVSEKNNDGSGRYITADGKIYYMYADEDANAWLYEPDVIATMAAKGYEITDNVSANKTKIVKGKLVVTEKGVEKTYVKSQVKPRAFKYVDSTTKLTVTAAQTTVKVDTNVTLKAVISDCDEAVDYKWYYDDGKSDGSDKGPTHVTQFSEPMTHSLYAVATGRTSKKTVKSNVVTIKFVMDNIRPEMAGAWVNKSDSKDAVYFKDNGQLFVMNQKSASDWYLSPKPIAELADDSAIINEVDPDTYKIWVNRTEKTLYIEKNGKRAEYKQNKSLKARDGKYVSNMTSVVLVLKDKEIISATDSAGTVRLNVRSLQFDALDEEVSYQWINAETNNKISGAKENTYVYTRKDDLTETATVSRALRITGKTSGANITSETATFTVEPKNVLGLLKGYWAASGDTSTGYAILEDGSVYKAFEKTTTVGKTTQKKNLYYGSAVATADKLGKFAKKGNLTFTYNEEDKTLTVAEDANSSAKNRPVVLSRVSVKLINKADLLSTRSTMTIATDAKKSVEEGEKVKFTATIPEVDEDVEISWFLNGTRTAMTGKEFEVPVITGMGGTTFKVQAFAKGVLSDVQISSDEMSISVDAIPAAGALRNSLQKPDIKIDSKINGADLKTGTETTKTTTKK